MLLFVFLFLFLSVNINCAFDAGFLELSILREKDHDTTHYSITVCALCRATIDYLKSAYTIDTSYLETRFNEINGQCQGNIVNDIANILKNSTKYGVNPWQFTTTIKTIASSNTKTDLKETFSEESHFDSESFIKGSQLVLARYQATLNNILKDNNYDQARKTFGQMLHTVQDFYSHSNFIEFNFTSPNDVIGQRIFQENEYAPINMRTCINCKDQSCQTKSNFDQNFQNTKLLTSGYFIPIGLSIFLKKKPKGKCSHGGTFDSSKSDEPTGGINKDTLNSIHGNLHYKAATMAYRATVKILNQLRNDITNNAFGLFLGIKKNLNSLVICIDTSYSMIDYIELAKDISINIANQYGRLEYAPHNYILISFDDDNAKLIINSPNSFDLTNAIQTLKIYQVSNSTLGEMYYHGLIEGLKQSESSSVIYTFTDSPANDGYLKYQARALLRSKQAVIYSFMSQQMKIRRYKNYYDRLDPLDGSDNDTDLASISGGLTYPIFLVDRTIISEFILRRLEWTRLQSLVISKSTSNSIEFYIDSSIDEFHLDISSMYEIININQIILRRPDNSLYPLIDNYNNTKHLYMWKILQPNIGAWNLITGNLSEGFNYDVQIQGKTSIICSSTLQKEMEPNTDTTGYTQLTTEPIINSDLLILTTCENLLIPMANISLIDISGNIIASYLPIQSDQLGTITRIHVPQQQFRIQTIITLINGTKIQRLEKQLISPTIFSIELTNQPYIVSPGQTIQMNYTIKSITTNQISVRLEIMDTMKLMGNNGTEINLTFINQTSGTQTLTLPDNYRQQYTTNLVIFSVSTLNNQTKKFTYENDETVSIYLEINSSSFIQTVNYFIISLLSLLYYIYVHN